MKKILIVDDDEMLRSIYEAIFHEEKFEVITAFDGEDAWEKLSSGSIPDVIFTGIIMPRMSGFDLVIKIKQDPRFAHIPIAISSHRGLPEDRERAKSLGINDFIIQGTTPAPDIIKRIEILVGIVPTFRIALIQNRYDNKSVIDFLNKIQGTQCSFAAHEEALLELEAKQEQGDFHIKLICND